MQISLFVAIGDSSCKTSLCLVAATALKMSFPIDSDTMGVKLSSVPYLFVWPRVQDLRSLLHKSLCRYPSPLQFFSGSVVLLHVQSLQLFPLAANFILVRLCSVGPFCYRNSAFAYIGPVHYLARWSLGYVKLLFFWCVMVPTLLFFKIALSFSN